MTKNFRMNGLVPATFTPMHADGSLNLAQVPAIVDRLLAFRVMALFACGTTGECSSMTSPERKATLEAYVAAAAGRIPVVAHVGHTAIQECRELAAHAERVGAAAVATTPPFYFKPGSIPELVDCMAEIAAAAPSLPFYYYHIPHLTGVALDMEAFLRAAGERIPNLAGIKYTAPTLYEFQACAALENGRFNMLFGTDEMLLAALATGAKGAVGSTYNIAAPLYHKVRESFEAGNLAEAQRLQLLSAQMVGLIKKYRPLPALKAMMKIGGIDCGPTRRPLVAMSEAETAALKAGLAEIGFLEWMR